MQVTIDSLKKTVAKKGYKWFDNKPHIIAIRTNLQIPDVFNDPIFLVYKDVILSAICTTEPGVTYQKKLLNPKGCWVMMPAQMEDAYALGLHQGKEDHKCLRSVGKIFGLREDDKDGVLFNDKDAVAIWVDGTMVGANIHGAVKKLITKLVGPWSAGCQVISEWEKKEEFINFLIEFEKKNKSLWKTITEWVFGKSGIRYTYTLLEEKDLII
jgi:hypothetical protein